MRVWLRAGASGHTGEVVNWRRNRGRGCWLGAVRQQSVEALCIATTAKCGCQEGIKLWAAAGGSCCGSFCRQQGLGSRWGGKHSAADGSSSRKPGLVGGWASAWRATTCPAFARRAAWLHGLMVVPATVLC